LIRIQLDAAQTIGNPVIGDTDTTSAAGWTLAGNNLTLDGATPQHSMQNTKAFVERAGRGRKRRCFDGAPGGTQDRLPFRVIRA
jgi:hypothetical protein